MKAEKPSRPPAWAVRLLTWYCKPELLEDLQGDLQEYFHRNLQSKGLVRSKIIYALDVIKFFRIYTTRKPDFLQFVINWLMIGSYIKTSGRTMVRNKLFSAINIIGLAISMSVGLVMIGVLSDIGSYDQFHDKHERIYRVISGYEYLGKKDDHFMATTSMKAAKAIEDTFSAQEAAAILHRQFGGDFKFGEKVIPLHGFWANPALFKVFSFKMLKGNAAMALKDPFSIILTETSAKKLFGNDEALGKTLILNNDKEYTVTGILQDVPVFSHMKFDILGSLSTRETIAKDIKDEMAWDNVWSTWVYLLMPPDADLGGVKKSLDQLSVREDPSVKNTHVELALQPMDEIMTGANLGNQIGSVMGGSGLWIFGSLAFVVILSACFNYTNLSIARSLRRTREVGIRKVIGALKSHVIGQFVVEAVMISLAALVLAFLLFISLRPFFLGIEPKIQSLYVLELTPRVVFYFILLAVVVGMAAGLLPALFFSRINAVQVLKNVTAVKGFRRLTLRKALIVFQYCISIIFITSTFIAYKQYRHFVAFDLGFKTDNILNISLQGNKADLLKKEIGEMPEVVGISQSQMVTSVGDYWGTQMKYHRTPNDSAGIYFNTVDENYLPLHGHQLIAGRNFSAKADSAETEVIVNEQILKRFNIANQDPFKALDEMVTVDGKDLRIVGVMKDFYYGRANNKNMKNEVILRYTNKDVDILNVKIESRDLLATHAKIEAIWKKMDTVHPLQARFYNDQIEEAFGGLKASVQLAGFLAFLAICIASMGLLGMVVFTTETRLKEISIRKVLGATEAKLIFLLGRGFIILLGLAALIALPLTYVFVDRVAFREMANHAPLSTGDMFTGFLIILLIALIMVLSQTLKAARSNPAEVLKNE